MSIDKTRWLDLYFNPIEFKEENRMNICEDCYFDETECPFKNRDEIVDVCAHYSKIKKSSITNFDKKVSANETADCDNCMFRSECNDLQPGRRACKHYKKITTEEDVLKSMIRKDLYNFMGAMERVLKENDFKGGWEDNSIEYLYGRLLEEIQEVKELAELTLLDIFQQPFIESNTTEIKAQFEKELLDVANMCMMIWSKL